jgi:hypothetical protein
MTLNGRDVSPIALSTLVIISVIGALLWNLATAALLLVALDDRLSFWNALVTGMKASWAAKGRWWLLIVAQMLLLGYVTYLHDWKMNLVWTGGYENESHWYEDTMDALKAPKVDVIATAMELMFGVLAIAVKLSVAERLWPRQDSLSEPPNFDLSGGDDSPPESDAEMREQMRQLWRARVPMITPAHSDVSRPPFDLPAGDDSGEN